MLIRIILIAGALLTCAYLLRGRTSARRLAVQRIAGLGFASVWVVAVIVPDSVTRLAQLVGVGRGTDLLVYLLVLVVLLLAVTTYQRIAHLEERLATLTREMAIQQERPPLASPQSPESTVDWSGRRA